MSDEVLFKIATMLLGTGLIGTVTTMIWKISAYKTQLETKMDRDMRLLVGAIRALISTVDDEGERRAIEAQFVFRNSPTRINYESVRALVAAHGRPPGRVLDVIRTITADASLDEDWKILGAVNNAFTSQELTRAYRIHGGDAFTFNKVVLLTITEARERGIDSVLREAGLMDEETGDEPQTPTPGD